MQTQQLQQILTELRFSAGLSDVDQQKLAEISRAQDIPAGTVIFTEGSRPEDLYLLRSGRVELCMNVLGRGCIPIMTLEAGDLLGWSMIVGQGEMTATATAAEETQAIAISAGKLRDLCEQDHDVGYQIMRRVAVTLSQRLVSTRLQVLDMFAESPPNIGTVLETPS